MMDSAETANEQNEQRIYRGKTAYLTVMFARWRKLHLITLFLVLIASFTACFNFVVYNKKFYPHCPLYGKLVIVEVKEANRSFVHYVTEKTEWGPDVFCNFVLYVPLVSILLSVAWILIFTIKRNYSPNSHRKLVPATCFFGFIATVLTFAGAVVITKGGSTFCDSFKETDLHKCLNAQYVHWLNFPKMYGFYDYLLRSQISTWITTHIWFYHSVMSLLRWVTNADYVIAEEREGEDRDIIENIPTSLTTGSNSNYENENEKKQD